MELVTDVLVAVLLAVVVVLLPAVVVVLLLVVVVVIGMVVVAIWFGFGGSRWYIAESNEPETGRPTAKPS